MNNVSPGERLKIARKSLGLSQRKFGEGIGVSRDVIKNMELELVEIKEHFYKLFTVQFNILEEWLRYGIGEMFQEISQENELATYCAQICAGHDDHMANIILAYMRLEDDNKEVINKFIDGLLESAKETKKDTSN